MSPTPTVRVRVASRDHIGFRSILEAYQGLASWFSDGSGVFAVTSPPNREEEFRGLIEAIGREGAVEPV